MSERMRESSSSSRGCNLWNHCSTVLEYSTAQSYGRRHTACGAPKSSAVALSGPPQTAVPRRALVYQCSHCVQPRAQPQLQHQDHGKVGTTLRQIFCAFARAAFRVTCLGDTLSLAPESVVSFRARSQGFVI